MVRSKFKELFYGYIVNESPISKQIHRVKSIEGRCQIARIKHGKYITKRQAKKLYLQGYDGCYLCNHVNDKKHNHEEC